MRNKYIVPLKVEEQEKNKEKTQKESSLINTSMCLREFNFLLDLEKFLLRSNLAQH